MTIYALKRLFFALFVSLGAVTIIFIAIRVMPGDPAELLVDPTQSGERVDELRESLGLNDPIYVQYVDYLGGVLRGDFGESYRYHKPAFDLVLNRFPATVQLATTAMLLAILVSFPIGLIAGTRPRSKTDLTLTTGSLITQSLPEFWVGIVLSLIFARTLGVLPTSGNGTLAHLVLPAVALSLPFIGMLIRLVRAGTVETMSSDFVRTARSKGITQRAIVWFHAFRNMLIPVTTMVGLQFGKVLSGSVIVETVFGWPGVGRLLIDAISSRDYPVIQAALAFITLIFIAINLIVDLSYGIIDPRLRREFRKGN